ncbi:MAG: NAD(P)H nitroreductase [Candidatus Latescibacteria bacterium]|nr:NAD(P)H nitroreductase [bacterium]MBD3424924.1 NAD(P)H nitroreductase [Candidatus Latescibacterota bacterium]
MPRFMDLVKGRRSIRSYQDRAIPADLVNKCVRAALYAPTACNRQRVRIIIASGEVKDNLVSGALGAVPVRNSWASQAPVMAVFAVDRDILVHRIASGLKKIQYDFMDVGIAGEHFVLQATELGLGTCWIGWFKQSRAEEILDIPGNWNIYAMITLGYPASEPGKKKIIPESDAVIFRNGEGDE